MDQRYCQSSTESRFRRKAEGSLMFTFEIHKLSLISIGNNKFCRSLSHGLNLLMNLFITEFQWCKIHSHKKKQLVVWRHCEKFKKTQISFKFLAILCHLTLLCCWVQSSFILLFPFLTLRFHKTTSISELQFWWSQQ